MEGEPDAKRMLLNFVVKDFDQIVPRPEEVSVRGISLGYSLSSNGKEVSSDSFPPKGIKPSTTKYHLLNTFDLSLKLETEYSLHVWVRHNDKLFTLQKDFNSGLPAKTYKSMIWDEKIEDWEFAKPYPQDGKAYSWDEEAVEWKERYLD